MSKARTNLEWRCTHCAKILLPGDRDCPYCDHVGAPQACSKRLGLTIDALLKRLDDLESLRELAFYPVASPELVYTFVCLTCERQVPWPEQICAYCVQELGWAHMPAHDRERAYRSLLVKLPADPPEE